MTTELYTYFKELVRDKFDSADFWEAHSIIDRLRAAGDNDLADEFLKDLQTYNSNLQAKEEAYKEMLGLGYSNEQREKM